MPYLLFCLLCVAESFGAILGSSRVFQVFQLNQVSSYTATVRYTADIRPGFSLNLWVEDGAYNALLANGLNSVTAGNLIEDRQAVLREFGEWLRIQFLPQLEGSLFNFIDPQPTNSPGINLLFLDIQDDFVKTRSYVAAMTNALDQNSGTGFNAMNLVYVDLSPATLGLELVTGVNKRRTYLEIARSLIRLLQIQKDPSEELYIQEGICQGMLYRLLAQEVFPNSQARIIDAPASTTAESFEYLKDLTQMRLGVNVNSANLNRVRLERNPQDPRDNTDSDVFKGFAYLYFSSLFHQMGGNFQSRVSSGDRFFQSLMTEPLDGLIGLRQAMALYGSLGLEESLKKFYLSLCVNNGDPALKYLPYKGAVDFTVYQTLGSNLVLGLDSFQFVPVNLNGPLAFNQVAPVTLQIPAGRGQSASILLERDLYEQMYPLQDHVLNPALISMNPGDKRVLLLLNLNTDRQQFNLSQASQTVDRGVVLYSSQTNFGSVTTELEIEAADLPLAPTTSISIQVSLSNTGVYDFTVRNRTTSSLIWSIRPAPNLTGLSMDTYGKIRASVSSLLPSTSRATVLQRELSTQKLVFTNRFNSLTFTLLMETAESSLFPVASTALPAPAAALSADDYKRIAGGGSGGCFLATASYGIESFPVLIFSQFRDEILAESSLGQELIRVYYLYSPQMAENIKQNKLLQTLSGFLLLPFLVFVYLALNPLFLLLGVCIWRRI